MFGESDGDAVGGQCTPIACSLTPGALTERLGEWRALVVTAVSSVQVETGSVSFALHDSDEALLAAASLGAREKECCPFFDVTLEIEPDRRVLRLAVPAEAAPVLDDFVRALRP